MARLGGVKQRAAVETAEIWELLHRPGATPALPSLIEFAAAARAEQVERLDVVTKKAGTMLSAALAALVLVTTIGPATAPLRVPVWLACLMVAALVLAAALAAFAAGTHWTFPLDPASVIRADYMDDENEIRRVIVDHYAKSRILNARTATSLTFWVDAARWLLVVSMAALALGAWLMVRG